MSESSIFPQIKRDLLISASEEMLNSFTLVSLEDDIQPLVYVNRSFVKMTGYPFEEIIGKNCRFLQGQLSGRKAVDFIGINIRNKNAVYQDLINYRKDQTPFWNRLVLFPVELVNEGIHFIGIQHDVTEKKIELGFSFRDDVLIKRDSFELFELKDKILNPLTGVLLKMQLLNKSSDAESLIQQKLNIKSSLDKLSSSILNL